MNKRMTCGLALGVALTGAAFAQPRISAQSIIVNPTPADLTVRVRVDRDPSGTGVPNYRAGENVTISTTVNQDAYVYLFSVDPSGDVTQILPNRLGGENFVKANTTAVFPPAGSAFRFTVDGEAGLNKVLALASTTPLDLSQLSTFRSSQDQFATVAAKGQQEFAQALSIVVNPVPQNNWVTDTAFFNVTAQTPVQTGSVFVGTNVPNATVYLNNQRLGGANVTYSGIRPGTYPVRVQAPGARDYTTTVTVRAGGTTNVNADFPLAVTPQEPGNVVLDLFRNLLGAFTGVQLQDPARSAYDQKVADLQRQGYALQNTRQTSGGYVGTLTRNGSTATLTVTRGANRTLNVQVTENTQYRY
ncbi:DUF4384 domain-containing protein [Deinococcus maricopensis]|uniref:PEGA domain protein n=1 Tax=Deinococcus maricopensis (strain DSM 21211 / LMG 22137 / NRRL B-23946 / LB-34) TaxID=709986 RepID=E8U5W5_DEIML|nr:DUF4384 domain-containing protein [Deinococcus maricopensis]ADV66454.1 PEGA domain protein [Deinococcus maricopensis DSM 21211]